MFLVVDVTGPGVDIVMYDRRYLRLRGQIHGQDRSVLGLVVGPAGHMVHGGLSHHRFLAFVEQVRDQGSGGVGVVVAWTRDASRLPTR
jgi:hypothetical protein